MVSDAPLVPEANPGIVFIGFAKVAVPRMIGQAIARVCPEPPGTSFQAFHVPSIEGWEFGSPDANPKLAGVLPWFTIDVLMTSKVVTFAVSQPCSEIGVVAN